MTSPPVQSPSPSYFGVQALRGFAACLVVAHHASQVWSNHVGISPPPGIWFNGAAGVDVFFVISGFVMAMSSMGKGAGVAAGWEFLKRRLLRVVPMYWLITSVLLAKMILVQMHPSLGNGPDHVQTSFPYVLASYLLFPYRNSQGLVAPLLIVGWTLSFEMVFYLLFTSALMLRIGVARLLTPVLFVLAAIGLFHQESWPTFTVLADPILLEFLAGLWLGCLVKTGKRMRPALSVFCGAAGLVGLLTFPNPSGAMRPLVWGLPALLIVLAAVMLEIPLGRRLPRWSLLLGDASYSLYLSHLLSFSIALKVLTRLHVLPAGTAQWQDEILTVLVCLLVSVAVAIPLYRFVEKPITEVLRRRFHSTERPKLYEERSFSNS